jgi:hypothetical protein
MNAVAIGVIAILLALAALHLYWGFGGFWPGRNQVELADRVIGTSGRAPPDFIACAAVAFALSLTAYIVAAQHGAPKFGIPHILWKIGYWGACLVFLVRAMAAYMPRVFAYAEGTAFYTLNRRYYGPLCAIIAAAMALSI